VANLTLVIDDDTLRRARIRALEEGTSVNAVVRDYLERFADAHERALSGRRRVVEIAHSRAAGTAGAARTWTRDEVYDERTRWPRS
jgi:plasmid stability protein